ncbi:MAG: Do family serine endopeptidase [Alphaproteobacteria bacterium]
MALVVAFFLPAGASAQQVPQSVQQMQLSFAPLVKKTSPAVVNIYTKRVVRRQVNPFFNDPFFNQFFGGGRMQGGYSQERVENSLGSGVIISADGRVATNRHVISGATEIAVVTSDGREFKAEKVLEDSRSDLAVLKLDLKGVSLPWLQLADSDAVEVGDLVLAIGNPFGVGQTVTSGIVSGVARTVNGPSDYNYFIQTDAAINPGNSGGALVDMNGKLVGINSMIFSKDGGSVGIGFAIPSAMLQTVVDAATHGARVVRPWTGLQGQPVTADMVDTLGLQRAQGALINRVNPRSPAAKADIKAGDVILTVNGRDVADPEALKYRLATVPLGTPIKLQLVRNGKLTEATMVAEAPPEDPPRQETKLKGVNPFAGATVVNISPAVSEELGGTSREQGVVVLKADEGNAGRLGLGRGDILLGVNGEKINSVKELKDLLEDMNSRRWAIQVLRGEQVLNLMITI